MYRKSLLCSVRPSDDDGDERRKIEMERNSMWRRNRQKASDEDDEKAAAERPTHEISTHHFLFFFLLFFSIFLSTHIFSYTFFFFIFSFSESRMPFGWLTTHRKAERRKKYHPTNSNVGTIACVQCVKIFSSNIRLWLSCAHNDRLATAMSFFSMS